tara:strand:+ start:332 stop:829 length:498 start_codon:yes stop_codon:yes gene_type:complete
MAHSNCYTEQIIPQRFIIHVSYSSNRDEILSNGLLSKKALHSIKESKGVFAHNDMCPNEDWYPYTLDKWELKVGIHFSLFDMYDYWVIDTSMLPNNWFVDTIGEIDFLRNRRDFHLTKGLYIMTKEDVPRNAIKLYKFQTDEYWEQKGFGAHHFQSKMMFRPFKF